MYIKMGFMRLSSSVQVELIPLLFQSIPNRTTTHQETLLGLIVHALQHVKIIPNMAENVVKYGLVDQPTLRHLFLNFLLNVLLLTYKFVWKITFFQQRKKLNSLSDSTRLKFEIRPVGPILTHLKTRWMKYFFPLWRMHPVKKRKYSNNHFHA